MSDEPNLECPHCHKGLHVTAASVVGKEQRLVWSIHPKPGELLQAKTVGGTLEQMDRLIRACAREDGGKVRCYVEAIRATGDGGFHFDLAVLPVTGPRDSGSGSKSENSRSEVEAEGPQSGAPKSAHRPNPGAHQEEVAGV